jgi:hypothetical protein
LPLTRERPRISLRLPRKDVITELTAMNSRTVTRIFRRPSAKRNTATCGPGDPKNKQFRNIRAKANIQDEPAKIGGSSTQHQPKRRNKNKAGRNYGECRNAVRGAIASW